ncbi:LysR family transcriptional regulator [Paenacidovorax monticola]|nr:LysR family transcriptional regulator [Paenacidovorax monticola]
MNTPPSTSPRQALGALGMPPLTERLKSLRALQAVATHGSTAQAAQAMHTSQPAVTRSIQELEKFCGLDLFSRATRGMAPTPIGALLAKRTETLFLHLSHGATEAIAAAPPATRRPPAMQRFASTVSPSGLRSLVAIAAAGSEGAAAALLGVTQPAVHAALQSLEQSLGVHLFHKLATGTQLAPAGEALLRRAKLALAEIRAMEGDLAAWRGEVRGRIVVGVLPLSVSSFLTSALEALLRRHPNIQVQVVDGTYESLVQQLLSADVDAIAGALRNDAPAEDIRQHHLFDDDLVIVARAGHPCLAGAAPSLRDLLHWEWVMPLPDTPADLVLRQLFRAQGLEPPARSVRASSPMLTQAFVMQAGRLALGSRVQAESQQGPLRIVPLALPSTRRRIGMATRAMGEPSHDLQLFLDACKAAIHTA